MKRLIFCASVGMLMAFSNENVTATGKTIEGTSELSSTVATPKTLNEYITNVYKTIDFGNNKLGTEVFAAAYKGYLNLKQADLLSNPNILTVIDFTKSSSENRLWVIDLAKKKVLINDLVAHGQGSGGEYATTFSNTHSSHQSSIGFYVTDQTYVGKHGNSLRLRGMDNGYNSEAYERAVVVHASDYVNDALASAGRLGRSWGCPAVSNQVAGKLINTIKNGSCLFIYYPQPKYLQTAYWLNKNVNVSPFAVQDNAQLVTKAYSPARDTA
jgi:hypothetical protein